MLNGLKNVVYLSSIALMAPMIVGCASAGSSVPSAKLVANTSFATGLAEGQFEISGIRKGALKTTYNVKANNGDSYSCYYTGIAGVGLSDSLCSKIGAAGATDTATPNCDALSKAAGRC